MTRRHQSLPPEVAAALQPYGEEIQELVSAARAAILAEAPDAVELVYDGYNAVAIAYSFTGKLRDAFCHVSAYRHHVNLGFNRGSELADPDGVLLGAGKLIRHVRLTVSTDAAHPALAPLIREAAARAPKGDGARAAAVVVKPPSPRKRRPDRR